MFGLQENGHTNEGEDGHEQAKNEADNGADTINAHLKARTLHCSGGCCES